MRRCANGDGSHTSPDPRRCCRAIVTSAALPTLLAKKAPSVDDGVLFERRPRRADAIVRSCGDESAFSTARGEMATPAVPFYECADGAARVWSVMIEADDAKRAQQRSDLDVDRLLAEPSPSAWKSKFYGAFC